MVRVEGYPYEGVHEVCFAAAIGAHYRDLNLSHLKTNIIVSGGFGFCRFAIYCRCPSGRFWLPTSLTICP